MKKSSTIFLHKLSIILLIVCISSSSIVAQYVADYKRNADKYYAKGDWYSAAIYYEKYMEQKKKPDASGYEPYTVQSAKAQKANAKNEKAVINDNEVVYRIAECYRKINDYSKAAPYYAKSIAFDKAKYPLAGYYHAVCLRANNKYAEAEKQFESFLKSYSSKDEYAEHAKLEIANCKFIQQQLEKKEADAYKVAKLNSTSTAAGANYAPAYNNGQLVFTSSRADSSTLSSKNKNPFVNNIYTTTGTVQKLGLPVEVGSEQGAASFTANGNRVYFTRWTKKEGNNISAIYLSENKSGSWTEPVKLGTNVNAEGFSSKQPFVTPDGKYLLYASNRSGGQGNFDIWYAPLNTDGEPGSFLNLGKNINTKGDDETPYYTAASNALVFASNGRIGMGGFDLFESKGALPNNLSEPVNLGYPVNSVKDDIYFTNKGSVKLLQDAIISTDRASACCLELFTLDKTYKKYVTGKITDCKTGTSLDGVSLNVTAKTSGKKIVSQNTDANGTYFFEVKEFEQSTATASKAEYTTGSFEFTKPATIGYNDDTLTNGSFCLTPIEKIVPPVDTPATKPEPEPLDEKNALFDFAKYSLRKETVAMMDTLASILKREKNLGLEILGYTDKMGSTEYNLKLSQERADACYNYFIKQGVDPSKLKAIGKGECCPIEPETINGKDNPAGRQANRRVEFKIKLMMK